MGESYVDWHLDSAGDVGLFFLCSVDAVRV